MATLKATTDGPASLTYTVDGSEVREDIRDTWERTVELTDSPTTLSLTIVSDRDQSAVGCEITGEGINTNNMSRGAPATVTCSATIP